MVKELLLQYLNCRTNIRFDINYLIFKISFNALKLTLQSQGPAQQFSEEFCWAHY